MSTWAAGFRAAVVLVALLPNPLPPDVRGQEAVPGDARLAVPRDAEVAAETAKIREILADSYATAASQKDFEPLIAELGERGGTDDSPAYRYALYKEAERLAVEAGLFAKAMEIAAERCRSFKSDSLDTRMAALDRLIKQPDDAMNALGVEFARRTIDVALFGEHFGEAQRALDVLAELAKRQGAEQSRRRAAITKKYKKKIPLPNSLGDLVADLARIKEEVAKCTRRRADYDAVAARLKSAADERIANAAGVYLALQRNDWPAALPLLRQVRGPIGAAAKGEIEVGSRKSPEALVEAANAWWAVADVASDPWNTDALDAAAYKSHAADLYLAALPSLTGKVGRDLVMRRIGEAPAPRGLRLVEEDALNCRTASEASQVYKIHASSPANPVYLAGLVAARAKHWEQLAEEKRLKLGDRWLKPADHERERAVAQDKIVHAMGLLLSSQFDLAKKELDEASALDPEDAKAESLIGLVYASRDNDMIAIEHWLEGLRREPNNAALLNNLGVCEIVTGRHRSALGHFRQASRLLLEPAIVGNIAFAVRFSDTLGIKGKDLDDFNELARQTQAALRASGNVPRAPAAGGDAGRPAPGGTDVATAGRLTLVWPYSKGWTGDGSKGGGGERGREAERLGAVAIGYGTGFVVAPGVVLTNEHVVRSASEIMVHDPSDFSRQLVATVIASDKSLDLALLKVDDLKAPPLVLAATLPSRTTDIMAMGFPGGPNLLGNRLKSTKGAVISSGDPTLDGGNFLHSCLINPGNSGGPIVDEFGEVIGVVRAIAKISEIGDSYSIGIPVDRVLPFFNEHRKKFEPPPPPPADGQAAPPGDPSATPPADPSAPPPPAPDPNTPPSGGVRGRAEALKSEVEGPAVNPADPSAKPPQPAAADKPGEKDKTADKDPGKDGDKPAAPVRERRKMAWPEVDEEASRSVLLIVCKEAAR